MSGTPGVARKPRRDDLLDVRLDELDERGNAWGRTGEYRVSVRGAVPGATVRARVIRRRKNAIDALQDAELEPSPHAVAPRCRHVASCGGCSFQGLDYPAQLEAKGRLLARVLAPLGELPIEPVLGCARPWNYRNKMDFTFGNARWIEPGEPEDAPNGFAAGLHVRGNYRKILDVGTCEIAFPEASEILASARALALEHGLDGWDVKAQTGLLKHLVVRRAHATGELLVDLVTSEPAPGRVAPLCSGLLERHPGITTLVHHVNPGVALVAVGELERTYRGTGTIEERLGGLAFTISAHSFFQTNTAQAEELVRLVREHAAPPPGGAILDLYCGCGVFALALARDHGPERVVGFELVESAVADARANAGRNGLAGVRFVAGDLAETLAPEALAAAGLPVPAVCVVDPPRAGLHDRVVASLTTLAPARIVYVSCNPRSAARDLAALVAAGYRVVRVRPVDLFPHTPHLECVFVLERDPAPAAPGG